MAGIRQIEPKLSPFDPFAMLDEIQRLVPGYDVSRLDLLAANDVRTRLVSIATRPARAAIWFCRREDTLFTSGTLGRYSDILQEVHEQHRKSRRNSGGLRP